MQCLCHISCSVFITVVCVCILILNIIYEERPVEILPPINVKVHQLKADKTNQPNKQMLLRKNQTVNPTEKGNNTNEETRPKNKTIRAVKKILYWNPKFLDVGMISKKYIDTYTEYPCKITDNRDTLSEADAVVFDTQHIRNLPQKRRGQVWVYETAESPSNGFNPNVLKNWNNLFNWTMSYRRDSDLLFMYIEFATVSTDKRDTNESFSFLRNKKRNIVWFVGNCRTASRREDYAGTLGKNCEIYKIGNCGRNGNECPRNDAKSCMRNLLNNEYKFYFSAENSLCRDYITEKSFERMQYNVIPFVRGGANYSMFLPPGSYIDAGSFNNQSETCTYLLKVGKNEKLYNEYHIWRQNYKVTNYDFGHERPWREFCMRLHNEDKYRRLYRNIKDWWRGKQSMSGNMCY